MMGLAAMTASADEGMWTLYNLPQAVYEQMKGYGYELPYDKLYQADDAIMKSVVNFSGYWSRSDFLAGSFEDLKLHWHITKTNSNNGNTFFIAV